jgi:hypothetical protein
MSKYIISITVFLSIISSSFAQKKEQNSTPKDSTQYKTAYGIRLGVDLSKPTLSFVDKSYSGLEIVGDYRISKSWYVAAEMGYEKETSFEDFLTSSSKGSFMRVGVNYNAYKNWLDMTNEIFVGFRYGLALFEHSLDSYTPNVTTGSTNTPIYFPSTPVTTPRAESGLMAHWTEFQLGIKVETLKNLYVSGGFSYKIMLSVDDQSNFKTLYAPGFNRVFETNTGFGFFYTLSYMIPIVNK